MQKTKTDLLENSYSIQCKMILAVLNFTSHSDFKSNLITDLLDPLIFKITDTGRVTDFAKLCHCCKLTLGYLRQKCNGLYIE